MTRFFFSDEQKQKDAEAAADFHIKAANIALWATCLNQVSKVHSDDSGQTGRKPRLIRVFSNTQMKYIIGI